jgi:phage virion morphogenesis protein
MTGIVITTHVIDAAARAALQRLGLALRDSAPLMRAIGIGVRDTTQGRMDRGLSPDLQKWAPLNPDYAFVKKGAGILRERGMRGGLQGSLTFRAASSSVTIGTNAVHAAVHQFGATIKPKASGSLVFRLGGNRVVFARSVTIPARPYLGIGPDETEVIEEQVVLHLDRAAGSGRSSGRALRR